MNDETKERIAAITNPNTQIAEIYSLLDELGITYKKTTCKKCRRDLLNILKEEAGIIESAADNSEFNAEPETETEWEYICNRAQTWHGNIIDGNTPDEVIREFIKQFPTGYYVRKEHTAENE